MRASILFGLLTLLVVQAAAARGLYECAGPKGEHYYSDKGCKNPDPPPPEPGGTLTLLPGKNQPASPTIKNGFATQNRYTQRAEAGAAKAQQHQ
ncbi:MAG TPA: hypothetical protein VHE37_00890 [Nevskiaceae bacterium]|nr:hypothetical protein [Nevskiaceae bacterium]